MKLEMEVVGKVENAQGGEPHYFLHFRMTLNDEEFKVQGQAFVPAVEVEKELFNATSSGDIFYLTDQS
jgi:hypothetical protein